MAEVLYRRFNFSDFHAHSLLTDSLSLALFLHRLTLLGHEQPLNPFPSGAFLIQISEFLFFFFFELLS